MAGRGRPTGVINAEPTEYRGLSSFTKHDPPKFEGKFDPEGSQRWIADIEKIFNAMGCREEHKVGYATCMLCGEVEDWWKYAGQTLPQEEGHITWEVFKTCFLGNYFPKDLQKQKAREFLELKQGDMSVEDYAAKFHELMKFWPHYQHEGANAKRKSVDTRVGGLMRQDRRPSRCQRRSYSGLVESRVSGVTTCRGGGSGSDVSRELLKCF
ncbi:uncharacterized protein LOC113850756 [Abrus precatorius]|uniref:Uncharacterized protein LOC113850756 n=1 Tax=Abrus precatorius TaxID=3816 RepID=A0A8B8K261_ABRPR|nr:uncharacterized protein LOC113850756 [Abrus precatorius]